MTTRTPTFADGMEAAAKIAEQYAASYPNRVEEGLTNNGRYFAVRDEHYACAARCIAAAIRAAKTKEPE